MTNLLIHIHQSKFCFRLVFWYCCYVIKPLLVNWGVCSWSRYESEVSHSQHLISLQVMCKPMFSNQRAPIKTISLWQFSYQKHWMLISLVITQLPIIRIISNPPNAVRFGSQHTRLETNVLESKTTINKMLPFLPQQVLNANFMGLS